MTTVKLGCAEVAAKGKDLAQNEILCFKICAKGKDLAQIAVKRKDLGQK